MPSPWPGRRRATAWRGRSTTCSRTTRCGSGLPRGRTCSRTARLRSSCPARSITRMTRTPLSSGSPLAACTSFARRTRSRRGRAWVDGVRYEIHIAGALSDSVLGAFPDFRAEPCGHETVLVGALPDQAALHGVLAQIEALALELVGSSSHHTDRA